MRSKIPSELLLFDAEELLKIGPVNQASETWTVESETPVSGDASAVTERDLDQLIRLLEPAQQGDELARLGAYRLLNVLGMGGMGIVFQAEDIRLNRMVAIKFVRPLRFQKENSASTFLTEARAAAKLTHDNIVTVYHVGQHGDVPFLVMQLLSGQSLSSKLRQEGNLDPQTALEITRQIALALAAAHQQNIVHRDIKPDNIWLEESSQRVKNLDFGLAHFATNEMAISDTRMLAGTPNYMAPERIRGEASDHRADLYSAGVVLYEMLSGVRPFHATATSQILRVSTTREHPSLVEFPKLIDHRINQLVDDLLEKDRELRVATADDLVRRIDEIVDAGSITAVNNAATSNDQSTFSPYKKILLIAFVVAISLGIAIMAIQYRYALLESDRLEIRARNYPGQMNQVQEAWQEGHHTRLVQLLDELLPVGNDPDLRGWEWNYFDSFRRHPPEVAYKHAPGFSAVAAVGDFVAWADNGTSVIQIQNVASREKICDLGVDGDRVVALALSGDGRRVACSTVSETVQVWDIATKTKLLYETSPVACLALNRVGDLLVVGANEEVTVFDVSKGIPLTTFEAKYLQADTASIFFSPDDQACAIGIRWAAKLQIHDSKSWKQIVSHVPYEGEGNFGYFGIAWHPNSELIAIGHAAKTDVHGTITVWNWQDEKVVRTFSAFPSHLENKIATLAFDASGERLVTGEQGGVLAVWEPLSGVRLGTLPGVNGELSVISWSSDGNFVFGGIPAGSAAVWNLQRELPWTTLGGTGRMDWSFDSRLVSAKSPIINPDKLVGFFDSTTGKLVDSFVNSEGDWIPAIDCCPVDARVAFSVVQTTRVSQLQGDGSSVLIIRPGNDASELQIPTSWILCLAWSPDGKYLVGGQGKTGSSINVWDGHTGQLIWTQNQHLDDVRSIEWSPDGSLIASKDVCGLVVVSDARTGRLVRKFDDDVDSTTVQDGQRSLAFNPDGSQLVVGFRGQFKIWELSTGICLMKIDAHSKPIIAVAWSPDGKRIATGGGDFAAKIWNAETGQLVIFFIEESAVAIVSFSPDGNCFATHAAPLGPIKIRRVMKWTPIIGPAA